MARAKGAGMEIQFLTPPVSKRLHGWRRIARRVKLALQSTLVIEIGPRQHTQDSVCIGQPRASHATLQY